MNLVLSELGWIEKDFAGWQITKLGESLRGRQLESEASGGTYVMWPEDIISDKNLSSVFKETSDAEMQKQHSNKDIQTTTNNTFREKFPATPHWRSYPKPKPNARWRESFTFVPSISANYAGKPRNRSLQRPIDKLATDAFARLQIKTDNEYPR